MNVGEIQDQIESIVSDFLEHPYGSLENTLSYHYFGAIICDDGSNGKTSVLRNIWSRWQKKSIFLDCKSDLSMQHIRKQLQDDNNCLVLVDNIDEINLSAPSGLNIISFLQYGEEKRISRPLFYIFSCKTSVKLAQFGILGRLHFPSDLYWKYYRIRELEYHHRLVFFTKKLAELCEDENSHTYEKILHEWSKRTFGFDFRQLNNLWNYLSWMVLIATKEQTLITAVVLSDSFNEAFFAIRYQEISLLQIPSQENIGSIDPLVGFDEEVKLLTDHFDKLESLLTSKPSLSQNSCFPPTGYVIYGDSGCGKTTLANMIGERYRGLCNFLPVSCADLVHKVVGESEKRLTEIFQKARELAPTIILFDNIDDIVSSPLSSSSSKNVFASRTSHAALDRILSTLLIEIDGMTTSTVSSKSKKPIFIIATCSHVSRLDRALVRPGRLEVHVELTTPNLMQQTKIFEYYLQKSCAIFIKLKDADDLVSQLSNGRHYRSGSQIRQVVQEISMATARKIAHEKIAIEHAHDEFILQVRSYLEKQNSSKIVADIDHQLSALNILE